jgi:trans-2-enoyl-CoA reductase
MPRDYTLLGVYATRPPLPAVGGGEGVGVVTSVGAEVTTLGEGDWVVMSKPGLGERNCHFHKR